MKVKMKARLTVLFVVLCGAAEGQRDSLTHSQWEEIHCINVQATPYIFDGTVTKQEYYYNKKGEALTCNIVNIRGAFCDLQQQSTVKVITKGIHINRDSNYMPSGREGYFIKGEGCFFFCKLASSDMIVDSLPKTGNAVVLTTIDSVSEIVGTKKGMQWDDTIYRFDSLIRFFYKNARYDLPLINSSY